MSYVCGLPVGKLSTIWLLVTLSLWGKLSAYIARHCENFDKEQLTDMGNTVPCWHGPDLWPYAECNVTNLKKDLTEVKPGIKTLCVHQNDLIIHHRAFSRFPSLKHLHITGFHIKRVESGAFTGLPNLTSLFLQFHDAAWRDVSLDPGVFEGLEHLEGLDISGLKLPGVSNEIFKPLLGLANLHLWRIGSTDLGEVFCLLPIGMSNLHNLTLDESHITAIKNQGCATGTKEWPTAVLSQVKVLSLLGTPVATIETDSLKMFQNLSSLSLTFRGKSVSTIWESGIGQVMELQLSGQVVEKLHVDFKSLGHLVCHLGLKSLTLNNVQAETLSATDNNETCIKQLENFLPIPFGDEQQEAQVLGD
ncbi:leucine-rich repeat and immunoglobulin-like domain-containing nogo receptor-interacting protein 1 [Clupea harengus]|uniref:leucine-rich repeat and immunoglobulin-like domain-containing nogo receptor-interacting protein 1 n=1 Tax=Clupea harengus TaxID=7950 RepID=UPI0012ABD18F|nr:leucine-rich repeat and immunoglobulin-like domain-containing nogo receptor-interacting protein 1 [Clupea harengus]